MHAGGHLDHTHHKALANQALNYPFLGLSQIFPKHVHENGETEVQNRPKSFVVRVSDLTQNVSFHIVHCPNRGSE